MIVYKEILVVLLLAHTLADFYFQTEAMAKKKEKDFLYVIIHSVVYGLVCSFYIKLIFPNFDDLCLWVLVVSHFAIDVLKYYISSKNFIKKYGKYIFFVDQVIHLTILAFVSYLEIQSGKICDYNTMIINILNIIEIPIQTLNTLLLQLLLIHKPINIFIVKMMESYKPDEKKEEGTMKVGRLIGTIERVIILFFLLIQQYSSIGLVLTAKSIARYNKISENQEFAEYYLLGTLLSTICVIIVSLL